MGPMGSNTITTRTITLEHTVGKTDTCLHRSRDQPENTSQSYTIIRKATPTIRT